MSGKLTSGKVKKVTQHIFDLPTLPTTVTKIIELVDNQNSSAQILSRIISGDQALTAQILKLANSAYYGFPRKISTVPLAIVVIGLETLKNMALSISIIDRFSLYQHSMPFNIYLFWEHAIGTAIASRMLAKELKYQVTGEIFAAGLLHDLGKYIMSLYFKENFSNVMARMIYEDKPMYQIEEEVFPEINHAQVGAWLVEKWNFPEPIVMAINFHHQPEDAGEYQKIAWLVNLGDYLTKKIGVGYSGDMSTPFINKNVVKILRLRTKKNGELDENYYLKLLEQDIAGECSLFSFARLRNNFPETPKLSVNLPKEQYVVS